MKIALVHDHLAQDGGAEKVLKALSEIYPTAPIFVLVHNVNQANPFFKQREIKTSFIQKLPGGIKHYKWFLPLMPTATESFDLNQYNLVISSSSALAKGIITTPRTLHINYCHTPTRYLWSDTHQYIEELAYSWLIKKFLPLILTKVRIWDRLAAERVDYFIANSLAVQQRIKKYYNKDSTVIYPPVATNQFQPVTTNQLGNYYLIGGRLVPYKRYDLAIMAFNKLGIPLKIFGNGPEEKNLRKMAKDNIEFVGRVNDEELAKLYSQCLAFINPQEEDFGISAVEAMAAGRPVIAYGIAGALETVKEGITGRFFDEQSWEALADTVVRFKPKEYNSAVIKEHAQQFAEVRFKEEIKRFVEEKWVAWQNNKI